MENGGDGGVRESLNVGLSRPPFSSPASPPLPCRSLLSQAARQSLSLCLLSLHSLPLSLSCFRLSLSLSLSCFRLPSHSHSPSSSPSHGAHGGRIRGSERAKASGAPCVALSPSFSLRLPSLFSRSVFPSLSPALSPSFPLPPAATPPSSPLSSLSFPPSPLSP